MPSPPFLIFTRNPQREGGGKPSARTRDALFFSRILRDEGGLLDPQLSLNLLQRRALRLRNHRLHPDKLQHHHEGKERENVADRKRGDHLREERGKQRSEDPVRPAAHTLPFRAMAIGKYFGDENPDHRSLADRVRGDEGEDANRHDQEVTGKESPRDQPERSDVADRADIKKSAPADPVNQPESDKGENQIRDADANRLQQRSLSGESGQFKDARREIQNRIDARHLIKERNQDGKQDWFPKTHRPKMSRRKFLFRCRCSRDLISLSLNLRVRSAGLDTLQYFESSRAIALPAKQPARTFRESKTQCGIDQ